MIGLVVVAVVAALSFATIHYYGVKKKDPGTYEMQQIAKAIQEGAGAFLRHEYSLILKVSSIIVVLLAILVSIPDMM